MQTVVFFFLSILLDCSIIPEVIASAQNEGSNVLNMLFRLTRTWVYSLHKERMKLLGRWNLTLTVYIDLPCIGLKIHIIHTQAHLGWSNPVAKIALKMWLLYVISHLQLVNLIMVALRFTK